MRELIPIGGITPFTTIDFPGHLAAVLYAQGCPWSCAYCHNPGFQPYGKCSELNSSIELLRFMEDRVGLLDGIVFSGGEPTSHVRLPNMMEWVRALGFKIGLHTTGMFPQRLREALPLCDWVGMDIKAPLDKYDDITRVAGSSASIIESIRMIVDSGALYEFRTTVHPKLTSETDLTEIRGLLNRLGSSQHKIQPFQAQGCADTALTE